MIRNKKAIAAKLAKELEATRALQPRLKREMYERQAQRPASSVELVCHALDVHGVLKPPKR